MIKIVYRNEAINARPRKETFKILYQMGFLQQPVGVILVTRKYLGYTIYIKYPVPYKINFRMSGTR